MIFVGWKIACGWSYFCRSKDLIANLLPVKFPRFEDRKSMDLSMLSREETREWKKKTFWFVVFYRFKMKSTRSASRSFEERNRRKSSEVTESCFQRVQLSSIDDFLVCMRHFSDLSTLLCPSSLFSHGSPVVSWKSVSFLDTFTAIDIGDVGSSNFVRRVR